MTQLATRLPNPVASDRTPPRDGYFECRLQLGPWRYRAIGRLPM